MPFGALNLVAIIGGAWLTNKFKMRFAVVSYVFSSKLAFSVQDAHLILICSSVAFAYSP